MKKFLIPVFIFFCILSVAGQDLEIDEETTTEEITIHDSTNYQLRMKGPENIPSLESTSTNYIVNLYPYNYKDQIPPLSPENLNAIPINDTSVQLSFYPTIDNVRVVGYNLYRDGVLADYLTTETHIDTGLLPATTYSYFVTAIDRSQNISAASTIVSVTTLDSETAGSPPFFTSGPSISTTTNEISIIDFSTNVAVNGEIFYGTTTEFGFSMTFSNFSSIHSITIPALEANTQYYYKVIY